MFGFFNPESLSIADRGATIDFINISDGQSETVKINSPQHAIRISGALRDQAERGITSIEGPMSKVQGQMRFREHSIDEGVMVTDDGRKLPFKLGFSLTADHDFPIGGMTIAQGVTHDGAFIIQRLAVQPPAPSLDVEAELAATSLPVNH